MTERTYRIQKVAELTGVPAGLIRAWERRYGVLRPRRTGGGYRAYSEDDVEVLRRLKQLTAEGVPISDAVRQLPDIRREVKAADVTQALPRGGNQVDELKARILEAAAKLDQGAVGAALDEALAALPPVAAYELVMVPVQREVGERWHQGKVTVAEEHLVTHAVRVRLLSLLHGAPRLSRKHVVCACFPDEDHEVGLLGAALRFRYAGFRVTYLGARTPVEHLARTVLAVRPDLVALSAVNDDGRRAFQKTLAAVFAALPPKTRVLIGGSGAAAYDDVCRELGALRLADESDWERLVA
jgi:DNA-binding transcriptional MerR regulator/methylmalonyl-CoA mutase cobalamin-binding subunit